jgi:hypothetical protein
MMQESLACPHLGENCVPTCIYGTPLEAVDGTIMEGGCPKSKRFVEDTNKFLVAIKVIREEKGCAV